MTSVSSPPVAGPPRLPEVSEAWRQRVLLAVVASVPLTFVEVRVAGMQLTGFTWLAGLLLVLPLALREPVSRLVLRRLTPYLLFAAVAVLGLAVAPSLPRGVATLVQLLVPVPAYLLAARVQDVARFTARAADVAAAGVALGGLLTVADAVGALPPSIPLNPRPMVIALLVLVVIGSVRASRARAALLFATAVGVAVSTGGRTSTAVLVLLLVLCPAWRLRLPARALLALAGAAAVVAVSQTSAFQERFFFGGQGSLADAVTVSESLNTAGRRELWPRLIDACSDTPLLGQGIGAGSVLAAELTLGVLVQPHNDFLRTYCDVGIVGTVAFWSFFAVAGVTAARAARRGDPAAGAAASLVLALAILALTDNPVLYTAHFMAPLGIMLGLASRRQAQTAALPAS